MWSNPGFIADFLRGFFTMLDGVGYFFLGGIFNIFFTIANAQFFQSDVIDTFYSRVQLILGVLMIFRISISLLQFILNPDVFKDKNKGAGSLVKRIAVMLIMLTLIAPINIPEDQLDGHPLNQQINANGILFGFLYQFQNSVVQDQVLAKLILGYNGSSDSLELDGMAATGDIISAQIAKAFITPTLNSSTDADNVTGEQLKNSENLDDYVACPDVVTRYIDDTVAASAVLDHVNDTCDSDGEVYAFEYTPIGGLVVSIVMTFIVIGFTLDIAVRAIKLAILRLIAPVPIISYVNPGADKNGPFGNWVKTLGSTYLSLFIRLIIIYFGVYLIILLQEGTLITWVGTSSFFTSALANIFIIVGILVFMKQAPKFFQDMLGIKGDGKLFSGIGTMLGAAALAGGVVGSVATGVRAGWQEGAEFRGKSEKGTAGRTARNILSGASAGISGLTSGIGGAFVGGKALATSDKKVPGSVMSAMQKRNAIRASHSTLPGRIVSEGYGMFTGRTLAEKDKQILEANQAAAKQMGEWKSFAEAEAKKNGDFGEVEVYSATDGVVQKRRLNYAQLASAMNSKDNNGNFMYGGLKFNVRDFNENVMSNLLKSQSSRYVKDVFDGRKDNPGILSNWELAKKALNDADIDYKGQYLDPMDIGKTIGIAKSNAQQMQTGMKHIKHIANHNANKSK